MKLGKKDPLNKQSLAFGDFLTVYPTAPLVDFAPNYSYPIDLNDQYGDCIVAGWDHTRQIITGLLCGTPQNFTQAQIIDFYKTQNPNFPAQDDGMSMQLFLEYLTTNGYIKGFAKIDHTNDAQMKAAMYLGLSIMTGVQLQAAQQTQFASGTWDYDPNSPIDGGHCINAAGYNTGIYDVVSWGKLIAATDTFIAKQMDEAWFILMQEHIDHPGFRNHFDLQGFATAVSQITDGKVVIPLPKPQWQHFTPTEPTGGGHTVAELKPVLVDKLDAARTAAGIPFVITSGYRTVAENTAVGGVADSAHLTGAAADIACSDSVSRLAMLKAFLSVGFTRIEICPAHIHVDISTTLPQNVAVLSQNG